MTIITTQSRITYAGDNVTTLFPIPFEFFLNSDITAVKTAVGGAVSTLVQGIDYGLTNAGVVGGGFATKTTPLLSGETLALFLNPPIEQESHYQSNAPFPASTLENDIDRQTQISLRLQDQISRSIRAPDGDANPQLLLPSAASRASTIVGFDTFGNLSLTSGGVTPITPGALNQPATGFFYSQSGAIVNRVQDRLFIGDAAANDGRGPTNVSADWLTLWQQSVGIPFGSVTSSVAALLTTTAQAAVTSPVALTVGARTLNTNQNSQNAVGIQSIVVNNSPTFTNSVYAFYGEAHRANNVVNSCIGMELDVTQRGSLVAINPYAQIFGQTVALQLASGAQQGAIATASFATNVMTITFINLAADIGPILVGWRVKGVGVDTTISSFGTGAGGTGTYNLSTSPGTVGSRVVAVSPQFDNSAAINIQANPTSFKTGINFGSNAITGTDGVNGGVAAAIQMGAGHGIFWSGPGGIGTGAIYCTALATAQTHNIVFTQTSTLFLETSTGTANLQINGVVSAANRIALAAATTGNPAQVAATGTDTNVNLNLFCQGTGLVQFGSNSQLTANGAVATTMTSLGPAGSHTTVQEWLTVLNPSGVTRYLPCY